MTWTVCVEHGEAVAKMEDRVVALGVTQNYRPRLWSYKFSMDQDFFDVRWLDDLAWRTSPRFAGIEDLLPDLIKAHPGLSGTAKMHYLRKIAIHQ